MSENYKKPFTGSQEPGQYPLNARELPKRKPPTADSLYRNGKTDPRNLIGGRYYQ